MQILSELHCHCRDLWLRPHLVCPANSAPGPPYAGLHLLGRPRLMRITLLPLLIGFNSRGRCHPLMLVWTTRLGQSRSASFFLASPPLEIPHRQSPCCSCVLMRRFVFFSSRNSSPTSTSCGTITSLVEFGVSLPVGYLLLTIWPRISPPSRNGGTWTRPGLIHKGEENSERSSYMFFGMCGRNEIVPSLDIPRSRSSMLLSSFGKTFAKMISQWT